MQFHRTTMLLVCATLLASPAALASWRGLGSYEPNTPHDIADGWMFKTPDQSTNQSINKVYFNGFTSVIGTQGGVLNPNVAAVPTQNQFETYRFLGALGVWKDCNKDGYIGLGESGLWEYRAELLFDTSVCPKGTVPNPIPLNWVPPHNDGNWIHEFTSIGWYSPSIGDANKFNINDNGARMWYDFGTPDPGSLSGSCYYNPPTGSLHSTGGVLFWVDCLEGYQITDAINKVAALHPALAPISFADANRTQYNSASILNQKNPWGEEYQGSDAQVWDCGPAPLTQQKVSDPTASNPDAGDGKVLTGPIFLNVSAPKVPPSFSTTGSPAGTANATGAGLDRCNRRTDVNGGGRGGALANAPYAAEASVSQSTVKQNPNGVLASASGVYRPGYCPLTTAGRCTSVDTPAGPVNDDIGQYFPTGPGTPPAGGQKITTLEGIWSDNSIWTDDGFITKDQSTFYAFVSPAAVAAYGLTLPKDGSTGSYGQEFCGSLTVGTANGWDCDATHWWKNIKGQDTAPRSAFIGQEAGNTAPCKTTNTTAYDRTLDSRGCVLVAPYPGSPYNLRDVDCTDNSVDAVRTAGIFPLVLPPPPAPPQARLDVCAPTPAS